MTARHSPLGFAPQWHAKAECAQCKGEGLVGSGLGCRPCVCQHEPEDCPHPLAGCRTEQGEAVP